MRQRPFCVAFLFLTVLILFLKTTGSAGWWSPVTERLAGQLTAGEVLPVSGRIGYREEKDNSIYYLLQDARLYPEDSRSSQGPDPDSLRTSFSLHNVSLYLSKDVPVLKAGTTILVWGKPELYANASNPGGFDAADYYAGEDCYVRIYADSVDILSEPDFSFSEAMLSLREKIAENLSEQMEPEAAAVLCAMLLGDRRDLDDQIRLDYSAAGLSHVLAISGFHVGLFGTALFALLMRCRLKVKAASLAVMAFLGFYCVFTGGSGSTIRAAVMFSVSLCARSFLRSYDPASALSLSGILILLVRPMLLFRSGFQLSFAAALSASCVYPLLQKRLGFSVKKPKERKRRLKQAVISAALLWLCVSLATFPLVLYHYYSFPLYSLLTNLVFLPLMGVLLLFGAMGAVLGLFLPAVSSVILLVPTVLLQLISSAGHLIRQLPAAMIVTGKPALWQMGAAGLGLLLAGLLLAKNKRPVFALVPALLVVFCALRFPAGFSLTALDVGQGDSLVLRGNTGETFLIDSGSTDQESVGRYTLLPYLKAEGITRIAGIFLTHEDRDHTGGILELLEMVKRQEAGLWIGRICMPAWMRTGEVGEEVVNLAAELDIPVSWCGRGDTVISDETVLTVLGPGNGDRLTGNEGSLVLQVQYGAFDALLTGDLENEGETEILPYLSAVDCLKTAHHGSRNATGEAFLDITKPAFCIISAPRKSVYGHPHAETLARIEDAGADWKQTGLAGAIRVASDGKRFTVETYLE